jgi:ankyrin repeat protein
MLLDHGADTEETDSELYRTPLHWSCKFGVALFVRYHLKFKFRLLIERGADINSVDKKKRTPLYYLNKSLKRRPDLAATQQFMVERGAKLTYKEELPQY